MKKILIMAAAYIVLAQSAEARTRADLRKAEKLALTLTGEPLPADIRKAFLANQIELEGIAEKLSQSKAFIEYYAQFWTRTLGVQGPLESYALRSIKSGQDVAYQEGFTGVDRLTQANDAPGKTAEWLDNYYNTRSKMLPRILVFDYCNEGPLLSAYSDFTGHEEVQKAAEQGIGPDNKPILPGSQDAWRRVWSLVKDSRATCTGNGERIMPWWDPNLVRGHAKWKNSKGYMAPPWMTRNCGPKLEKCSLVEAPGFDVYMDEVDRDMTMEAGYLIAHTVAENKPFSEVLTSTKTIMTGIYAYFMGQGRGKILWPNYPNGKIADQNAAIFSNAKVDDETHYWIDRGPDNAGVLTTPIFQTVTNGRRAKANRSYETFLCKKFVVPDGAKANPADSNPDLTKRQYCDYCHKSLEPMAAFFNRWPTTGNINFEYNPDTKVDDTGRFNGETAKGAAGLAKIMVESDDFESCSIKRAFEFTHGRKMTTVEAANLLPTYTQKLKASNMNLRLIMKDMILDEEFLEPKAAQK